MLEQVLPFLYVGGATVTGGLAILSWRNRHTTGAGALAGVLASVSLWLVSAFGATVAQTGSVWGYRAAALALFGVGGTTACLFLFALRYASFDDVLAWPRTLLLAVHPVLVLVVAVTNDGTGITALGAGGHSLVFDGLVGTADGGTDIVWGPAFWAHMVYTYVLVAVSTVLVVRAAWRSNDAYRGQSMAMLVAILIPWVANAVDVFVPGVSGLLAVGFCLSAVVITLSVLRFDLTSLAPVARPAVMEAISDGVVVVDGRGRVRDVNERARTFLGLGPDAVVGEPVEAVLPAPFDAVCDGGDEQREFVAVDDRVFDVATTGFGDDAGRVYVLRDVTEQHAYRRELERKTERLDRFASVVSHDLRNPLSVAQGYLDLLEETDDPAHVETIRESHDRMEALVDDLLVLAREGETATDPEPVALASLAERAWKTADTGSASLVVPTDAVVEADPDRTVQLFENLYRNAVEHGGDGSGDGLTMTVDVRADGDGFFVADDGVGLPDDREDLFESGVSGDGGTGLGLSIVGRIAESHGWSVSAGDSADGGARFDFEGVTVTAAEPPGQASP